MKFHKNLHIAAMFATILALNAQAAEVSSVQVKRAVSAWAAANGSAFANPGSVTGAYVVSENGTNLYWIVKMSNGGAVIASPDTDLDLVVAVLEKFDGAFPAGHPLPSILKADMLKRLSVIRRDDGSASAGSAASGVRLASSLSASAQSTIASNLPEDVKASVRKANSQWEKYGNANGGVKLLAAELEGGDNSPFVRCIVDGFEQGGRYTHWNQGSVNGKPCYNYHTKNNEVCGCVATAGAAILQFFGVLGTETGYESPHQCTVYNKPVDVKTLGGPLDWSILSTNLGGQAAIDGLDDAGRELLGRATYDIGVLVGMSWASEGPGSESGAILKNLTDAFKVFGFNTSRYVSFNTDESADANQFMKTVYAQNWCGAPVALGIRSESGGHAVIACGYACDDDGDDWCRVFMGWGGSGDAWYKFPEVSSYKLVTDAITMIGYANDAVVPVFGTSNMPGIELTVPGWVDDEGNVASTKVNDNGYFGIRVPMSLDKNARKIEYAARNKSMDIAPFESKTIEKLDASRAELDDALPDEILFSVLNMTQAVTVESARAVALRDNKALMMISGNVSGQRTSALLKSIYSLDDTTDISNKFVFVFTSSKSSAVNGVDGDPSIGIFDPAVGSADLRWWIENGRLAYNNFIDYVDDETDKTIYTLDGKTESEITAMLQNEDNTGILDVGYDAFLRRRADAVVTVTGVDLDNNSAPFEVAVCEPAYGVITKAWTNCESVVFSAPAVYTNETEGIVYSCEGWSTNDVFDANGYPTYNPGNSATISIEAGSELVFTWVWRKSLYRVTSSAIGLPFPESLTAVTPPEMWCDVNSRVTFMATNALGSYALNGWEIQRTLSSSVESGEYENIYNAMVSENGNTLSFFVFEPLNVVAKYAYGASAPSPKPVRTYTVVVECNPPEIAGNMALQSGIQWGTNTLIDSVIHLAPKSLYYTDSTGGVWKCTGWMSEGELVDGYNVVAQLSAHDTPVYTAQWTLQLPSTGTGEGEGNEGGEGGEDPVDPTPTPDPEPTPDPDPVPAPIAFSSISQDASGAWVLTITNGVAGCWYHLYSSQNITVPLANWNLADTVEANPQKATADGVITFHAVGNGTDKFWWAKATSKETGE